MDERIVLLGSSRPADRVTADSDQDNAWEQTYRTNQVGNDRCNIYAVVVVGEDENDNVGSTTGYSSGCAPTMRRSGTTRRTSPPSSRPVLLVEIDTNNERGRTLPASRSLPRREEDSQETESANPYVTIDFGTLVETPR